MKLILAIQLFLFSIPAFSQKILFVGNSLTYSNDLPDMVKKIAEADGRKITVDAVALPDFALEDHWKAGDVLELIAKKHFDIVVFQQGPSALPASRANLMEYAIKFASFCEKQGSRAAFFAVWPSVQRSFDFDRVIESYAMAADTTHSTFIPAGQAWLEMKDIDQNFPLYSSDGFHPSEQGSFLAAVVIYSTLFNRKNLAEVVQANRSRSLNAAQRELIKRAAEAVIEN